MQNRIANKTVLITGASSGIGEACALEFAKFGAKLILVARRVERLEKLKQLLENEYKVQVFVLGLDVTNQKQVAHLINYIPEEYNKINILVNNAGLALGLDTVAEGNQANWDLMIDTNIKGFLSVLKLISRSMIKNKSGHIINVGSIAGVEAYAKGNVYCATKAAVHTINRSLREELVEYNIKVSEVMPGAVNTEFSLVRFNGDKNRADNVYEGITPLTASDVAELIVYTANLPLHVNLAESLILPSTQVSATKIHRR